MSTSLLLNLIQSSDRHILSSPLFGGDTRICLLSFIGASNYFITDFGLIWNRAKVYPNKEGILSKYYQPWVFRDTVYRYPWSMVPTTTGPLWFPIMQLLGWAFDFLKGDTMKRYYLPVQKRLLPYRAVDGEWHEVPPIKSDRSRYLKWMDALYGQ